MIGRNLVVLNINDNIVDTFESGIGAAKHFIVHPVSSWQQVQLILSGLHSIPPPDVILLDVSFDRDEDMLRGASISEGIIPVGPTLALPFLFFRPVMAFAPYSAHMNNDKLKQHPPFLVAMGIIAAKMENKIFGSKYLSLNKKDNSLDLFIDNLPAAGNPVKGLEIALPQYRTNLMKAIIGKRLLVMNSPELINQLQTLEEQVKLQTIVIGGEKVIDVPSTLYLEVSDREDNVDRINLVSLFADKLSWVREFISHSGITEMLEWLQEVIEDELAFEKAIEIIKKQDDEEERTEKRPRVDMVIKKLYGSLHESERREIFRLCILFANVHACCINNNGSLVKKEVYIRLGLDGDDGINTYVSWFGGRSKKSSSLVCSRTINVQPLRPFNEKLPIL